MSMMWSRGVLLCVLPFSVVISGEPWSARQQGLAGLSVSLPSAHGNLIRNPAGIASIRSFTVHPSFSPGFYNLPELRSTSLILILPLTPATIGTGVRRFGFDLYRETSFVAGVGIQLHESLAGGIALEAKDIVIKGYGSQVVPLVTVGVQAGVSDRILVGGRIENILGAVLGKGRERIPRSAAVGVSAALGGGFLFAAELENDTRDPAIMRWGCEIRPVDAVCLRAALATDPDRWAAGGTISIGYAEFSYGGTFHPILGWTHVLELGVRVEP
ncbi:MAG: hypothetical protein HY563_06885 [Ignavibacteriales bacterium]|nr:hypothetical protein [Ignavibacteriales bacterium]